MNVIIILKTGNCRSKRLCGNSFKLYKKNSLHRCTRQMSSLRGVMILSLLRWSVFTYVNKRDKVLSKTDDHIYQHYKDSKYAGENAFLNNIISCVDLYIIPYIYFNWGNISIIIDIYVNILEEDSTYYPYFDCLFQTKCITNFSTGYLFSQSKLYKTSLIYYLPYVTFTDPLFLAPLQPPLRR